MPAPNRTELRTFILARFNRDEFGILCNDYFPDFYRDYEGVDTPLRNLAEALVAHCERHDQLERLRSAVHAARSQPYEATFGEFIAAEIKTKPRNPRQIFLSYAHQDEAFARRLQADLRAQGVPLWVATSSILPGEKWAAAIDRGLRESGIFAVILTPNTLASTWVEHELYSALPEVVNKKMRLLPLYAKRCDFRAKFPSLNAYQYIDFTQNHEAGVQALLVELGLATRTPPLVSPPKPEPLLPKIPRRKLLAYGGSALTLGTVGYGVSRLVTGGGSATPTPAPKPSDTIAPTATALVATSTTPLQPTTAPPTLTPSPLPTATVIRSPTPLPTPTATSNPNVRPISADRLAIVLGSGIEIEMVRIPAGEFIMGSDKSKDPQAYDNELPQHRLSLQEYWIGKTPITVAQFAAFIKATNYKTKAEKDGKSYTWTGGEWKEMIGADWSHPRGPSSNITQKQGHPVIHISWDDGMAYIKWASEVSKVEMMLPSEAEWEKAARGPITGPLPDRIYPWGNETPDATRCNFNNNELDTTPVGKYGLRGSSPYGCDDMLGNALEWTRSNFETYPYIIDDGRENIQNINNRVLRGAAYRNYGASVRCAYRFNNLPHNLVDYCGFRVGLVRL